MNNKTILSEVQVEDIEICTHIRCESRDFNLEFARAIEQAVLQSPEIQAQRRDAELYRWVKENIKEGYEFDGGYYISDTDTSNWDQTVRAAMEQQT